NLKEANKKRCNLMLSVWSHAPYSLQLCAVPTDTGGTMGEATARVERTETRAALPGVRRAVDAGHFSVRVRGAPLTPTGLYHRRTFGRQGVAQKTHHRANTARELAKPRRNRRIPGGGQRLASCGCPPGHPVEGVLTPGAARELRALRALPC